MSSVLVDIEIQKENSFPVDVFPDPAINFIKDLSSGMQVDETIVGSGVLSLAAMIVQGMGNVSEGRQMIPLSLYTMVVAESGERKTSADNEIFKAVREIEQSDFQEYQRNIDCYEVAYKIWKRKSSHADLVDAAYFAENKPKRPKSPKIIVSDPTSEGLFFQFQKGKNSLGLCTDEGAKIFGGYSLSTSRSFSGVGHFSNFWDGKPIERTRASDEISPTLYDKRLSASIMMQPYIFDSVWDNLLFQEQGFLARFLIAKPQSKAGSRTYEEDSEHVESSVAFHDRVRHLLKNPIEYEYIKLSKESRKAKLEYQQKLEFKIGVGGEYNAIAPFANKSAEQAIRIAGVLFLFGEDPVRRGCRNIEIPIDYMERGIALSEWYLSQAAILSLDSLEEKCIKNSEKVFCVLEKLMTEKKRGVYVKEVVQRCPRSIVRKTKNILSYLKKLENDGRVRQKNKMWITSKKY